MQFQSRLEPSLCRDLVFLPHRAEVREQPQVGGRCAIAGLERLLQQLDCKIAIFSSAYPIEVRDRQIHFGSGKTRGCCKLVPMKSTLEILCDTDSSLIEVANLVLRRGVSMAGGLFIPVRRQL